MEGDAVDHPQPPEIGHGAAEDRAGGHLGVLVRRQHEQARWGAAGEVAEHQDGGAVGPVEVVDHEQQPGGGGHVGQRRADGHGELRPPVGPARIGGRCAGQLGQQTRQPPGSRRAGHRLRCAAPREGGEALRQRAVGQHHVLVAAPGQHQRTLGGHQVAQLGRQSGLADPRLAHQRHQPPAGGRVVPRPTQHGELGTPADEGALGEGVEQRGEGRGPDPVGTRGDGLEVREVGAAEVQGGGQAAHGRPPRRRVDPTLEVAERAHPDAGAVGQLLLGEPPGAPVPLDEPAQLEPLLAHRTPPAGRAAG
ncbi:MAG: hypothetical protein K0R11_1829 [Acidimicrobiales bacterium]|nr:hypothetical protein [Acidimicrobiales bacterium]